jgi:TolB-like protein
MFSSPENPNTQDATLFNPMSGNDNMGLRQNPLNTQQLHNQSAPQRNINFYVRGLMQDLIGNLQFVNERTPVAVTSFVLLDSNYQETNLLGNQIAESLIHEVHKFGIPVIDFKTSPELSVTPAGDFIFTRDPKKLSLDLPVHYVFAGTLVKHQGGYLVNARVVGLNSKAVVASAQSFIPTEVTNALIEESKKQSNKTRKSISLVQGS